LLNLWVRAVGDYQINTILAWSGETHEAAVFDPGAESDRVIEEIERRHLMLKWLVNTHGHLDHIAENHVIKSRFKVPLLIHALDRPMLTDPSKNLSTYTGNPIVSPDADQTIADGESLPIGEEMLLVMHVPGHTPGSLVFYQAGMLIAGDTLFAGGVGRTDLPGGNEQQLYSGIREKLFVLPGETMVYPGHGPATTIGEERRSNPFVRA
jgi:glyoxylase-like metal-dependent hydrolase (beta-lactamase superfamily II)